MSGFSTPTAIPTTYTPTATAATGTLTTVSVTGRWIQLTNKMRFVAIKATITDNGTGAASLRFTLPETASSAASSVANWVGRNLNTGVPVFGMVLPSGTYVDIVLVNNAYPVATGQTVYISGTYETA